MTPEIITLASIPAILALTNLAKALGLSGKVSALLAVVLGIALAVGQYELAGFGWYQAAAQGLILGLRCLEAASYRLGFLRAYASCRIAVRLVASFCDY